MYNVTCLVTGKSDNLRMHSIRNDNGEMIGWIFLHESVKIQDIDAEIKWNFRVRIEEKANKL